MFLQHLEIFFFFLHILIVCKQRLFSDHENFRVFLCKHFSYHLFKNTVTIFHSILRIPECL